MRPLVIYHGNQCVDGWCAAWVAARALGGDVELHAADYGSEPPYALARDRAVYVVDFSYPRAQLERLRDAAGVGLGQRSLHPFIVLDHHKGAQAELESVEHVFDLERSGAGLAWDYFHPGEPRPWLVAYVEDRDLWRFALPDSRAIATMVRSMPRTLACFDELAAFELRDVRMLARGAELYLDAYVRDALAHPYLIDLEYPSTALGAAEIASERTACVNVPKNGASEVLHSALEGSGLRLALGWFMRADGLLECSLRSTPELECLPIAKAYGGGGHAHAAGFRIKPDQVLAQRLLRQA